MGTVRAGGWYMRIAAAGLGVMAAASLAAHGITFGVGSETSTIVQQTWPIAFAESSVWVTGGIWTPSQALGLEAGLVVFDLNAMKLATPLAYFLDLDWKPLHVGPSRAGLRIGFVHIPSSGWLSPYAGAAYTHDVTSSVSVSTSLGMQWTRGGTGYLAGWCIWMSAALYWLTRI
jgi:hypothetical protein